MNELPGVDLTIDEISGKVSGSIAFYFQRRNADGNWHVESKDTQPLLAPQANGKVLTFEVLHHKSHGSAELGPNVKFRMEVIDSDHAVLRQVDGETDTASVELSRQK